MPLQYIHTSARRGLEPGKSGFCCVARDREVPPDLGKELERLSRYEHFTSKENPWIARHMRLSIRSGEYHILSRLIDAGTDYSKRNNHLSHHLIFLEDEAKQLPDPATILLFWNGWRDFWKEPPRVLSERDQFSIQDLVTEPPSDSDRFPSGIKDGEAIEMAYTIDEGWERELGLHFRNDLLKLAAESRWGVPFTNFILSSDRPTDFLWRGNWKERPLPFDFEAAAFENPTSESSKDDLEKTPSNAQSSESKAETEPSLSKRSAPRVEIPEPLYREDRKRPKLKWTPKRLKRMLNASIGILALCCLAIAIYFLLDLASRPSQPVPAVSIPSAIETTIPVANEYREWNRLVDSGALYDQLDAGFEIAAAIASQGDQGPLETVKSLQAIESSIRRSEHVVELPRSVVSQSDFQFALDPLVSAQANLNGLALVPGSFALLLGEPVFESSIVQTLLQQLMPDRFIPEDTIIRLKAARRNARDTLRTSHDIDALAAAEQFQKEWTALQESPLANQLRSLESAIGIAPGNAFLARSSSGKLAKPEETDVKGHISRLYDSFVLSQSAALGPGSQTPDTLAIDNDPSRNAVEFAKAAYTVFERLEPRPGEVRDRADRVAELWRSTFIRDDLMEETIINFNLEKLASAKRSLARLGDRFGDSALPDLSLINEIFKAVDAAENSLENLGADSNWMLVLKADLNL